MMKFRSMITALALGGASSLACANNDGLVTVASPFPVAVTMQRLVNAVLARGLNVANLVDHATGAATAGLVLRPTMVLIFGNPKAGTPLMQCSQTIGIDLPLKALVWQDEAGSVWLSYNDMKELAKRHDIRLNDCPAVGAVGAALEAIALTVVTP